MGLNEPVLRIRRDELHEAVWRAPIAQLSEEWGVAYADIVHACDVMDLPCPGFDRWIAQARGESVTDLPPLPAPLEGARTEIQLRVVQRPQPRKFGTEGERLGVVPEPDSGDGKDNDVANKVSSETPAECATPPGTSKLEPAFPADSRDKLEVAARLIREALDECPELQVLELDEILTMLNDGIAILALEDSELNLPRLMLKHQWRVGQRFRADAVFLPNTANGFVVLGGQELPEGVIIRGERKNSWHLAEGQRVSLHLEIFRRSDGRAGWRIRRMDNP